MTDNLPDVYRLRSTVDGVEHEGITIDRLPVGWFIWNVHERETDVTDWVRAGYEEWVERPEWYAAELAGACFTVAEADLLEGYLHRAGRPGLERAAVTLPLPWRNETGDAYRPVGRLGPGDGIYGRVWEESSYDLPWPVAFWADPSQGIDRATGEPPLRQWRPSDGEIAG